MNAPQATEAGPELASSMPDLVWKDRAADMRSVLHHEAHDEHGGYALNSGRVNSYWQGVV